MKKVLILFVLTISLSIINTACKQEMTAPNESSKSNTNKIDKELDDKKKVVIENKAFQIFQPNHGEKIKDKIIVKGLARVYEGTVLYEFEDGNNILKKGFTTATQGAPGWGEFEIIIVLDVKVANDSGSVIIYEESPEDGSRMNELTIPVKVIQ